MLEPEAVNNFKNKYVRLTYTNDFHLKGIILEIYKETILFKTNQAESLIPLSEIKAIRECR